MYVFSCSGRLLSSMRCDKERQIKQTDKETRKQTNKQKVSRKIQKVYLFSCSRRLLSSVPCDKETRDEHQTKKARTLSKSENLCLELFFHNFMQTNKQKVSREIPKVYLFSCSGRLLSSVRCDKETRDEHQTKKARTLGKSGNLSLEFFSYIISGAKMVFYYQNCSDQPTVRKNCSSDQEKLLKFKICKIFEITRTIFSNSYKSEQFLVTECFFNLFLEVSHI